MNVLRVVDRSLIDSSNGICCRFRTTPTSKFPLQFVRTLFYDANNFTLSGYSHRNISVVHPLFFCHNKSNKIQIAKIVTNWRLWHLCKYLQITFRYWKTQEDCGPAATWGRGLSVWHGPTPDRHLKASSGKHKAIKMQMQHNPCVSGRPDPPGLEYLLMMSVCQPLWQEECREEKEWGGVWMCVRRCINGRRWEKRCDEVVLGLFTQLCF